MNKLKIAQIVSIWQSVPPVGYGGTERVVSDLTEGLVKRGYDVTLFSTGDSKTSAHLEYKFKEKFLHKNIDWNNYLYPLTHFLWAYDQIKKEGKYDIIHGHLSLASDFISISIAHQQIIPSVFTLHFTLDIMEKKQDRKEVFNYLKKSNFISISNNQRLPLPLNYVSTIYHGINIEKFKFNNGIKNDTMSWIGRIVPEKGLEDAIELSLELQKKLVIGGRVDDENKSNLQYFKANIEHKLASPLITHFGEIESAKRDEIFAQSKCFLFPIRWEEPFGLVMIEAMASGTPVVAYARGSVPEVIKDGETGFIVNSSDNDIRGDFIIKKTGREGLKEAIKKIYSMSEIEYKKMRRACRTHIENNFTVERMVDDYEKLYQEIIEKNKE